MTTCVPPETFVAAQDFRKAASDKDTLFCFFQTSKCVIKLNWSQWFSDCPVSHCSWPPFFLKRGHWLWVGGGVHPGQFASGRIIREQQTHPFTSTVRLKQPNYQLHVVVVVFFFIWGLRGETGGPGKKCEEQINSDPEPSCCDIKFVCQYIYVNIGVKPVWWLLHPIWWKEFMTLQMEVRSHLHYSRVTVQGTRRNYLSAALGGIHNRKLGH